MPVLEILRFCCGRTSLSEDTSGAGLVEGHRTLHDLLQRPRTRTLEARLDAIPNNLPATIFSTSGTTGLPKMIQRTHRELILESKATEDAPKPYHVRRLYCTPMFHAYSFTDMTINTFRLGLPSFYMRRYDHSFAWKLRQFSATETLVAPPVLMRLSNQAEAVRKSARIFNRFERSSVLVPRCPRNCDQNSPSYSTVQCD